MIEGITFVQEVPSTTWTINHNFLTAPISDVQVLHNGTIKKMLPMAVKHVSETQMVIEFSMPYAGQARVIGQVANPSAVVYSIDLGANHAAPAPAPAPTVTYGGPVDYSASNTQNAFKENPNTTLIEIPLERGQTLRAGTTRLLGAEGTGDTYLRFYSPSGVNILENDNYEGSLSYFEYLAAETGTYTVAAGCQADGTCTGKVVWEITTMGPPSEAPSPAPAPAPAPAPSPAPAPLPPSWFTYKTTGPEMTYLANYGQDVTPIGGALGTNNIGGLTIAYSGGTAGVTGPDADSNFNVISDIYLSDSAAKYVYEFTMTQKFVDDTYSSGEPVVGFFANDSSARLANRQRGTNSGNFATIYYPNGMIQAYDSGSSMATSGYSVGDVIGVVINIGGQTTSFYKNGNLVGTAGNAAANGHAMFGTAFFA